MEKQFKSITRTQAVLAAVVVAGFFTALIMMFAMPGAGTQDGMREARLIMLGSLQTGFGVVLSYYFGSTSGSDKKTDLLANSTPVSSMPAVGMTVSETAVGRMIEENQTSQTGAEQPAMTQPTQPQN